jgi:predicted DsbA family dithiol-disulfide isomerase
MARAAYSMAIVNPNIFASVVEVQEFPDMAREYRVMGVPKTIINGTSELTGVVPEEVLMSSIFQALYEKVPDQGN